MLALSEGAVPAGLPRTNHFGFGLEDPAQVRSARERFRRAGVTATEWQDDPGFVTRAGNGACIRTREQIHDADIVQPAQEVPGVTFGVFADTEGHVVGVAAS